MLSGVTVTNTHRDALVNQFGLADAVVDPDALANSVQRFRERGSACRPSPSSPTRARSTCADGRCRRRRARCPQPLAGALVQRPPGGRVAVPDHIVLGRELTGIDSPIIVVFGDRFPMITAHKVLAAYSLPRPAGGHGPVRPDPAPGDLAEHRQLRAGWHRHQPHHGQPRRRDPARRHEPGAVRLARPVVRQPGRGRDPHASARRATSRRSTTPATRSPSIPPTSCSTSSASSATTSATTRSPAAPWPTCSSTSQPARPAAICAWRPSRQRDRVGRHDRGRRPAEGRLRHEDRRRRGAGVPDDAGERLR